MIVDFFTELLHGRRFVKMRDIVLNVNPSDSVVDHRSVLDNNTE